MSSINNVNQTSNFHFIFVILLLRINYSDILTIFIQFLNLIHCEWFCSEAKTVLSRGKVLKIWLLEIILLLQFQNLTKWRIGDNSD